MSDEKEITPEEPHGEPRYRIEANTWEELLEQLDAIAPDTQALKFLSRREERPRSPEQTEPPEQTSHRDLHILAEEMSHRLESTPATFDEDDAPPDLNRTDWRPSRRSEPGAVIRRHHARRARQMETEAGYVLLYDAMLARELSDRTRAVREMEQTGDAARLERLAEHSPARVTRRAALDALARLNATPALESAALYVRPEVFTPKKPKATEEESASAARKNAPEFYDDTRDHAVDLLAGLADGGSDEALNALLRIVRYDFSKDAGARFRALRRLGERIDRLEARRDWHALSTIYRETKNASIRRTICERLSNYLEELEAAGASDALLAVSDMCPQLRDLAEAALKRIETVNPQVDSSVGGAEG